VRAKKAVRFFHCVVILLFAALLTCGCDAWFNLTQPLEDGVYVGLINKTPYRAIFTIGSYDPLDENSRPDFNQYRLEGNAVSWAIFTCHRAVDIGTQKLLDLIEKSEQIILDEAAFITGVNFSSAPADSPDAASPTEGTAAPVRVLHGVDYPCGALLIFTFVEDADAPGGFRVDFSLIK